MSTLLAYQQQATIKPEHVAFIEGDRQLSYQQLQNKLLILVLFYNYLQYLVPASLLHWIVVLMPALQY